MRMKYGACVQVKGQDEISNTRQDGELLFVQQEAKLFSLLVNDVVLLSVICRVTQCSNGCQLTGKADRPWRNEPSKFGHFLTHCVGNTQSRQRVAFAHAFADDEAWRGRNHRLKRLSIRHVVDVGLINPNHLATGRGFTFILDSTDDVTHFFAVNARRTVGIDKNNGIMEA